MIAADRERIEQIRQRVAEWDKYGWWVGKALADDAKYLLDLLASQGERRQQEHDEKHDDFGLLGDENAQ